MTLLNDIEQLQEIHNKKNKYYGQKGPYSHGLENIYALENVDPKSIRPIAAPIVKKEVELKKAPPSEIKLPEKQLELDLGLEDPAAFESFVPRESIKVLGLMRHAEKWLQDHQKFLLKDLIETNFQDHLFLKGLGQGHIVEIKEKLNAYLESKKATYNLLDFASLLRSLAAFLDPKKAVFLFKQFDIEDLMPLSTTDKLEINRLSFEQKEAWKLETFAALRQQKGQFDKDMRKIFLVFIKPWIESRLDIISKDDLEERVARISLQPTLAMKAIAFLNVLFFEKKDLFEHYIFSYDQQVFFTHPDTKTAYLYIIEKAYSYFYKTDLVYSVSELTALIERESCCAWIGFKAGFVEKALRLCPHFRISKDHAGTLLIHL